MTAKASRDRGGACTCNGKHLTSREIDILVRTAAGMSASQIATILHISRRTVEHHIASMLRRIAAENAVQAVSWCYAVGVLVPQSWPPQWSGQLCIAPGSLSARSAAPNDWLIESDQSEVPCPATEPDALLGEPARRVRTMGEDIPRGGQASAGQDIGGTPGPARPYGASILAPAPDRLEELAVESRCPLDGR
jgi:DNA-binding CsgD family transcriptional regulator